MDHPLRAADRAWLRMERPDNLMVITAVLTFDEAIDRVRLRGLLEVRLPAFPRFQQRLVDDRWRDDPSFDLERHDA